MQADSILFDLDGTLWDSVEEIVLTWNRVLERHRWFRPPITREEQKGLMGLQMDVIAQRLFPGEPEPRRMALMGECVREENEYLRCHGAKLYPAVEETLRLLQSRYKLCIVSNCQKGYIEAFLEAHRLGAYFSDTLCFGQTGCSKGENIKAIVLRNGFRRPVYVGDTQGDRNAAREAGIPFVYAAYGFGTVDNCDGRVDSFDELPALFS